MWLKQSHENNVFRIAVGVGHLPTVSLMSIMTFRGWDLGLDISACGVKN